MPRFVEESKMSKRTRKELNATRRKTWDVSPVSRKIESKKLYNRKRKPCSRYEDGAGLLFCRLHNHHLYVSGLRPYQKENCFFI